MKTIDKALKFIFDNDRVETRELRARWPRLPIRDLEKDGLIIYYPTTELWGITDKGIAAMMGVATN